MNIEISADGLAATLSFACTEGESVSDDAILAGLAAKEIKTEYCKADVIAAAAATVCWSPPACPPRMAAMHGLKR